jgi:PEP-CTERM motif-containing protein
MNVALLLCLPLAALFALPASAVTSPYSYSVDQFSSPERGFTDTFNDGTIGPQWFSQFGTVSEAAGVATFSDPGAPGFLSPFPLESDTSGLNGFSSALDQGGSFSTISVWLPEVPDPGTSYSMALGSVDGSGNTHQIAVSVTNTLSGVASVLGSDPGLNVDLILQVRDPSFAITSFDVTSQSFSASDVVGSVNLRLQFDDVLNQVRGLYSLDAGNTVNAFDPVAWNFSGGSFALVSSSTVPEPCTAALFALGLAAFGTSRRSTRWKRREHEGISLPTGSKR